MLHGLDVGFEPGGDLVLRNVFGPGGRERHERQIDGVERAVQLEDMIALPPAVADAFGTVDHQRLDVERLYPGRRRQTGVSTSDHESGRTTVEKGARFGPPPPPVSPLPFSFSCLALA